MPMISDDVEYSRVFLTKCKRQKVSLDLLRLFVCHVAFANEKTSIDGLVTVATGSGAIIRHALSRPAREIIEYSMTKRNLET